MRAVVDGSEEGGVRDNTGDTAVPIKAVASIDDQTCFTLCPLQLIYRLSVVASATQLYPIKQRPESCRIVNLPGFATARPPLMVY